MVLSYFRVLLFSSPVSQSRIVKLPFVPGIQHLTTPLDDLALVVVIPMQRHGLVISLKLVL